MALSPEEVAKQARFARIYARSQCPAILAVERRVCGCDYGGNSWTTRDEARGMASLLGLKPGIRLLDLGAGAGWPGLYLAKQSGCEAMLVDLPLTGLQAATHRAAIDRLLGRCWFAAADGAQMPFRDNSFDAISHSDVLCCLKDKRGVLESCRRVIRDSGRMVFTVIWITPGLSHQDYKRALESAPEFGEVESDYLTLLRQTGWTVTDCLDLTEGYASSVRGFIRTDEELKDELNSLLGPAEFTDRQAGWQSELSAIEAGLLRRDLFVTVPALA